MKRTFVSIQYEEAKIDALRHFTGPDKPSLEDEIIALTERLYQKIVPAPVREFIAAQADAPPSESDKKRKRKPNPTPKSPEPIAGAPSDAQDSF